jgi:hypothetical protein
MEWWHNRPALAWWAQKPSRRERFHLVDVTLLLRRRTVKRNP